MLVNDPRHGPLPVLLLALTVVTGLVDAISFLRLGHVFVSNMTGNVVFLGFAAAGTGDIAPQRSVVAIVTFAIGSAVGGRMCARFGSHRGQILSAAIALEFLLVLATLAVAFGPLAFSANAVSYAQVVLLALAMGVQNAAARAVAVPDLTTTVITLTMTAFASESFLGTGRTAMQCAARVPSSFMAASFRHSPSRSDYWRRPASPCSGPRSGRLRGRKRHNARCGFCTCRLRTCNEAAPLPSLLPFRRAGVGCRIGQRLGFARRQKRHDVPCVVDTDENQ